MKPPSMSKEFLLGWQAGWDAAFTVLRDELRYAPPSRVGEARFLARLEYLKSVYDDALGGRGKG